jgi:hypothetical protein
MIVSELIDKLKAMPRDMRVVVNGYEGDYDEPNVGETWVHLDRDGGPYCGCYADAYYDQKEEDAKDRGTLVIVISR